MRSFIKPNWSAPDHIMGLTTTRIGGLSDAPFDSFNLGMHVGDDKACVEANRFKLMHVANLPKLPNWLNQTHSNQVAEIITGKLTTIDADAVYTREPNEVCAILTADCLPVLFFSQDGQEIAAAHAGWRGLANGILENTVTKFQAHPSEIVAWLGPAIGAKQFEVGQDVFDVFSHQDPKAEFAFNQIQSEDGDLHTTKYLADLYLLAKQRLERCGVQSVHGGQHCTATEQNLFYSYRREKKTGRMATLVWRSR